MKRAIAAAFLALSAASVGICQSPQYETGDPAELRGLKKVFVTPGLDRGSQQKLKETITKKLRHIEFVLVPTDAELWLSLMLVPRVSRSRVPPNPNDPMRTHTETSDLVYEGIGRIFRVQSNQPPKLLQTFKGRSSDRKSLSAKFARDFINIYEAVNPDFKPAPTAEPVSRVEMPAAEQITKPAPIAADDAAGSDVEVLRVNTDLVSINVSILDRGSRYVSTLTRDAFSVFDQGTRQELSFFASVDEPFTVALLIDTSRSVTFKLRDIVNAANAFVDQLRPDDRLFVLTFDGGIREVVKTTRSEDVRGRGLSIEPVDASETLLYDAVSFALKERLNRIRGRKAIVILSDGVSSERAATFKSSIRDAEEAGALIYPIQFDTFSDATAPYKGPSAARTLNLYKLLYQKASTYLDELAEKTGGRRYRAVEVNDFPKAFASIVKELSSQYSLGFYPKPLPRHGDRRRIKVAVNMSNVVVRARRDYVFTTLTATSSSEKK